MLNKSSFINQWFLWFYIFLPIYLQPWTLMFTVINQIPKHNVVTTMNLALKIIMPIVNSIFHTILVITLLWYIYFTKNQSKLKCWHDCRQFYLYLWIFLFFLLFILRRNASQQIMGVIQSHNINDQAVIINNL